MTVSSISLLSLCAAVEDKKGMTQAFDNEDEDEHEDEAAAGRCRRK